MGKKRAPKSASGAPADGLKATTEAIAKKEAALNAKLLGHKDYRSAVDVVALKNGDAAAIEAARKFKVKHFAGELDEIDGLRAKFDQQTAQLSGHNAPGIPPEGVEGVIKNNQEAAAKVAADAAVKDVKAKGMFGIAHTEGMGAALSHNFGKEAWKASKTKVIFKGAGVLVGLGAVGDAMFRSEKTGPDGQRQQRSVLGRWTEAIVGAGIAAGSALHGGRS
jgi:hypothetical protein